LNAEAKAERERLDMEATAARKLLLKEA